MDTQLHERHAGWRRRCSDPRRILLVQSTASEPGVKLRGNEPGGVEIKGLVAVSREACSDAPFVGPIEVWGKWSSTNCACRTHRLLLSASTDGSGNHHQRGTSAGDCPQRSRTPIDRDYLPAEGCDVEYTEIWIEGSSSWVTLASRHLARWTPSSQTSTGFSHTFLGAGARHSATPGVRPIRCGFNVSPGQ